MLEAVAALGTVVISGHRPSGLLIVAAAPAPLRVVISGARCGDLYNGSLERLTRGSYDLAEMYGDVLAEGLPPCAPP